ncbi:MAG: transposase [Anaerolineales bacterium]|nr:transposase [Anaerolineales bacterium]
MNQFAYKTFYRRNLPHIQPEGATLFVTFRLANSLPREVIDKLKAEREESEKKISQIANPTEREKQLNFAERRFFGKWDDALDSLASSEKYLANTQVADLVVDSLHYRDGKVYDLEAFSIMPTHGHVVFAPLEESAGKYHSLSKIMHSFKLHTALEANKILGRDGAFWQHENYDHYVRDESELERIIKYVINNPVKAGLIDDWTKWKWTYCKYEM